MEKIQNNKTLNFILTFIANTVFAMILFPLLDMFFSAVIDKKEFTYSATEYIFSPIMYGFFLTIFTITSKNVIKKKLKS